MQQSRRRFKVEGRVQGVGFRVWTLREAKGLGLSGMVRNLPDGSVEVVAIGSEASVDEFAQNLANGPPSAQVTRVVSMPATEIDFEDFTIRG
jgi:acylphosphatase